MIKWYRVEFWGGDERQPAKPDDPWSATVNGWNLAVDPLRVGGKNVGWRWSVEKGATRKHRSYSGTVPGVRAVAEAKYEAACALKCALASEVGP